MKTLYTIVLSLLFGTIVSGQLSPQIPQIGTDVPNYIPPSPSVAALMKFEEVPVSNYTGIPDVSIPIFSTQTASPEVELSVSLNYHPSSIAVEEVAGFCGLGWSLNAGGSISRTVRGLPDDIYESPSSNRPGRIGIHHFSNPYYQVRSKLGTNLSPAEVQMINEFAWSGQEKGKYDMEHDLYQFNFFGRSGRFILVNDNTNDLQIVRLDNDSAVKIIYDNTTKKFTAYDPLGFRYTFDAVERTTQFTATETTTQSGYSSPSTSEPIIFDSAYQLTGVYSNNLLLIEYLYNSNPMQENSKSFRYTSNILASNGTIDFISSTYGESEIGKLVPKLIRNVSHNNVSTKKIMEIKIYGRGKIAFAYESGRQDDNISSAHRIHSIVVRNWNDVQVKKIDFNHFYRTTYRKRMFLESVKVWNSNESKSEDYNLFYRNLSGSTNVEKDFWGYLTSFSTLSSALARKEPHPETCKSDVLEKISFPTGGAVLFNYEANTYSHIGSEALDNFDLNPDNFENSSQTLHFSSNGGTTHQMLPVLFTKSYVTFRPYSNSSGNQSGIYSLMRIENGILTNVSGLNCGNNDGNCSTTEIVLLPGVQYAIQYQWMTVGVTGNGWIQADYRTLKNSIKQYLYGGGVRIKAIGHFEDATVPQNYYDLLVPTQEPIREKKYSYNFFNQPNKSSGSLVFAKPVFHAYKTNKAHLSSFEHSVGTVIDYSINSYTTFNNLSPLRTKGADVGYSNVTVKETGNGHTRYTYTSPIDSPEDTFAYMDYQVLPAKNLDYKRGLLKQQRVFDQANNELTMTEYDYNFVEDSMITGMRTTIGVNCPYVYLYDIYSQYYTNVGNSNSRNCGAPLTYIGFGEVREAYGWAQLKEKVSYSYFNTQIPVVTKEEYTYNSGNKLLDTFTATLSTSPLQAGAKQFEYNFDGGNDISRIKNIKEFKDGTKINEADIVYSSFAGARLYPSLVYTAKAAQPLEIKLRYNHYDAYGHPLEVQQENGMKVSYIYGYNQTEPVAKIENMAYASIPPSLIAGIHAANNEPAMTNALNSLRSAPALAGAMVTTYTYKPLVGVTSITDPKGDRITYEYDSFGRLKAVRDKDNNLLSENEYKYRTQN